MRLYLSSHRMGDRFAELVAAAPRGRVAVVTNALDFIAAEARVAYARNVYDPLSEFRAHGLEAVELDLRDHFAQPDALDAALADIDLIWATGGNAFLLRRALFQSGLDALIRRRLAVGDLIYGGWSAGAIVAGPTLRGLHLMDDPETLADGGYHPEPIWEGLGLIPFAIVPHFDSDHPEARAAAAAAAWLEANDLPFRTLRDGEVIVL